ncbi:glycosyl transferase family 90-domain-containing protein [Leucosporidium creatinivorum]|uniref:Glycosyl transferase family 90-domain-containing protein n=1 Tax=Leucosporidium creatinivorum TaxID=106004 RepID=A0A1Y2ECK8_9BASI|nr:glycosyl transferase family 90-domain-containing protein [Leucosporidium creatinivorum]
MRLSEESAPAPEQDDCKEPLLDPEDARPPSSYPGKSSWTASHRRRQWTLTGASAALLLLGIAIGGASSSYLTYPASRSLSLLLTPNETRAALRSGEALPDSLAANKRLSEAECSLGFPRLWPALTATREHFSKNGITEKDLEEVEKEDGTRVAIIDGQLFVKRFHGEWTTRSQAILASLNEAVVTAPEPIADVEFWFRGSDTVAPGPHFGLNRIDSNQGDEQMWLLVSDDLSFSSCSLRPVTDFWRLLQPDFGFWSWPEPRVLGWAEARRKARLVDAATPWASKANKLFWRGALLAPLRDELRNLASGFPWGDVGEINWSNGEGRVAIEDHCRHKYLASVEGRSYSGRLKYLALCRSVIVSHKMRYTQSFHGALDGADGSPDQNIIILKENSWSGLPETMEALLADQNRAEFIAENAVRTLRGRYLTPAATSCYWRRALAEYASVQRFAPTRGEGVDYESFMLMGEIHWDPHR